jgi:uncharacterized membrane protein HdeD (DUF308 family)
MCPIFSLNALTQFLQKYYWLFGTILLVVGVFLTFFGRKLFVFTVFIIGAALTVCGIMILFYTTFLKATTAYWVGWLVLSLSIVAGLGIGFLCTKVLRLAGSLVCGYGGFMLGVMINEMWLYIYHSQAVFWCVNIGLAVAFGVFAFFFFNQAVIVSTAFIGSYFVMRGISAFAGGFPPAFQLIE